CGRHEKQLVHAECANESSGADYQPRGHAEVAFHRPREDAAEEIEERDERVHTKRDELLQQVRVAAQHARGQREVDEENASERDSHPVRGNPSPSFPAGASAQEPYDRERDEGGQHQLLPALDDADERSGSLEVQQEQEVATPPAFSLRRGLVLLPPDWLPKALIVGDAIVAVLSVMLAYWFHHTFDPFHTLTPGELPIRPYLVALPFVVFFFVVALSA